MPIVSKMQVTIAGCGPAGLFAAVACAEAGLSTLLVGPDPRSEWPQRFCAWDDELPDDIQSVVAHRWERPRVVLGEGQERRLDRVYVQLDNTALQTSLWHRFEAAGGQCWNARVIECCHDGRGTSIRTTQGNIRTHIVIDATGAARRLQTTPNSPRRFQTAFGVVAVRKDGAPVDPVATFMDFRRPDRTPGSAAMASFLYALPLDTHRVFVEETVLTGLRRDSHDDLKARLERRLERLGLEMVDDEPTEHCTIPMDVDLPVPDRVVPYGAAASMVHPATGYSVARSAARAQELASTVAAHINAPPERTTEAAHAILWSADQRRRWVLFGFGRDVLSQMDTRATQRFFAAFFRLPDRDIADWLSDRMSSRRLAGTMLTIFHHAPADIRAALVRAATRNPRTLLSGLVRRPGWPFRPISLREVA